MACRRRPSRSSPLHLLLLAVAVEHENPERRCESLELVCPLLHDRVVHDDDCELELCLFPIVAKQLRKALVGHGLQGSWVGEDERGDHRRLAHPNFIAEPAAAACRRVADS